MLEQKKALVEWLKSPITKKYYESLGEHKRDLEQRILSFAKNAFAGEGVYQRSGDEVSAHTRLVAIDVILNDLHALFDFEQYCHVHDLEIEEVGDTYERKLVTGEIEETDNPLTIFIRNLYESK